MIIRSVEEQKAALPDGVALKMIAIDAYNFNTSSIDGRGLKTIWKFISINSQFV